MTHYFDTNIAKAFGIGEAIILNNIYYWIMKNKANERHFYDGDYWTYNSVKAFVEYFDYFKKSQIDRILTSLIEQNLIKKGNYNKNPYDRTTWYALTEKGKSIMAVSEIDFRKTGNGDLQNEKCITNTITDKIADKNNNIPSFEEFKEYACTHKPLVDLGLLKLKYESWIVSGWKTGADKPIKNWKSTLLNTLPYIKESDSVKKVSHIDESTNVW